MGGESSVLTASEARHLLRRAVLGNLTGESFGETVDRWVSSNTTRGDAADELLDFTPSHFKPRGGDIDKVHDNWIKYMIHTKLGLQEKLVLFWHDHFASGGPKVVDPKLLGQQNQLFRQFCRGNFQDFVKAINKNPETMEYLDTVRNHNDEPNENYARELQELFTLGVKDLAGNNNYTQADIVQIARAFTGWDYDSHNVAEFHSGDHDYKAFFPARGPKQIYTTVGGFGGGGRSFDRSPNGLGTDPVNEGAAEIDTVINIIFAHKDSNSKNTVARYIAKKLITYFANSTPSTAFIDAVVTNSSFDSAWDIGTLVREIFVHDNFYDTAGAPPYAGTAKKSVKWPIDYVVSTLRLLNMKLKKHQGVYGVYGGDYTYISDRLSDMGQLLFQPPSVFGWNWETSWINSATVLARSAFARDLIAARSNGRTGLHPTTLIGGTGLNTAGPIVDAVTDVLGVTDQFDSDARDALIDYLTDGDPMGELAPVDLTDFDTVDKKLRGLFGLVLQSPHYQLQ